MTILTAIGILLLIILVLAALCLFYPVSYRIRGEAEEEVSLFGRFWWLSGIFRLEFDVKGFVPQVRFGILWFHWSFGGKEAGQDDASDAADRGGGYSKPNPDLSGGQKDADVTATAVSGEKAKASETAVLERKAETSETAALERKAEASETAVLEREAEVLEPAVLEGRSEASGPAVLEGRSEASELAVVEEQGDVAKERAESKRRRRQVRPKGRAEPKKKASRRKRAGDQKERGTGSTRTFKEKYARFKAEALDEKNHMAVRHIWKEITYIVTRLEPKYMVGGFDFSTGDPALTGIVTGAVSILPVLYRYDACVYPDFVSDEPYIRGVLSFGGRMSLYHVVLCLIRLFRDKNAMQFILKFR